MNGFSPAPKEQRLCALKSLIPEAFCEGKIDWEKLKAALGEDVNFANERYVLNWAGKSDAFRILQQPSSSTLIPVREESVDFDNTQNIFIEGENLAVLKALQKSYFNKVKMIYIDPPYNTGNDSFIYPDKFSETKEEYLKRVGDKDEAGYMLREGRFAKNSKENGQYHSNWLNMMMPRLYLAKNLLREDGVIFVSIDDNEVHNLRLLMNEIFGEENFVAEFVWEKKKKPSFLKRNLGVKFEYILCFAKRIESTTSFSIDVTEEGKKYPINNAGNSLADLKFPKHSVRFGMVDGKIFPQDMSDGNIRTMLLTEVVVSDGYNENEFILRGEWRYSQETLDKIIESGDQITISKVPFRPNHVKRGGEIKKIHNLLTIGAYSLGTNEDATAEQVELFEKVFFDYSKPVGLIKFLAKALTYCDSDSIIMDFFAGTCTTAHAVMQLNKEDGGNRKYICVQLPERCDEKSEAFKAGYKTIADIAKERIRRAGMKIRGEVEAEQAKKNGELEFSGTSEVKMPDLGFKVFRLEDSNFKQWRKTTAATLAEVEQQMLDLVDPVKPDAAVENIVYELLLKSGKDLNSKIVRGNGFYNVNDGELVLLLESASQEIVDSVIALAPAKVIALDRLFHGNDQLKTNTSLQFRDSAIEFLTI